MKTPKLGNHIALSQQTVVFTLHQGEKTQTKAVQEFVNVFLPECKNRVKISRVRLINAPRSWRKRK